MSLVVALVPAVPSTTSLSVVRSTGVCGSKAESQLRVTKYVCIN